jgi:hypothetical protein
MLTVTRRVTLLLAAYAALLLAVIAAGFLTSALGPWAAILWALALLGGVALYRGRRARRSTSEG